MKYSYLIKKYNNQNLKKNSNNDGGYTLVELLAIIVVLSYLVIVMKELKTSLHPKEKMTDACFEAYLHENFPQT